LRLIFAVRSRAAQTAGRSWRRISALSLAQLRDYVHNKIEFYGAIVRAGDMKAD
jgi:hypothetical protein